MSDSFPNENSWDQVFFIVGPTGAGKSDLAIALAERLQGEIIGADAFQIYRGLPLLTAQPSVIQKSQIPHHLIGEISPVEEFNVGQYVQRAHEIRKHIQSQGKTAIIVGGSGMYVSALIYGLDQFPPVPKQLRAVLQNLSLDALIRRLKQSDEEALHQIDLKNPRRIQRAIEIVETTGKSLASVRQRKKEDIRLPGILLTRNTQELRERIWNNVQNMFEWGVDQEVAALGTIGSTALQAIGLRSIQDYLQGKLRKKECIEKVFLQTCQYAKRQRTWFKNQLSFPEINLSTTSRESIFDACVQQLRSHVENA